MRYRFVLFVAFAGFTGVFGQQAAEPPAPDGSDAADSIAGDSTITIPETAGDANDGKTAEASTEQSEAMEPPSNTETVGSPPFADHDPTNNIDWQSRRIRDQVAPAERFPGFRPGRRAVGWLRQGRERIFLQRQSLWENVRESRTRRPMLRDGGEPPRGQEGSSDAAAAGTGSADQGSERISPR